MGVLDGQAVSAAVTNPAFINKNVNDSMPNVLTLNNPATTTISDIQAAANRLYTATGASETATGTTYIAPSNTITTGESHQNALSALAQKFDPTTGHMHTGSAGDGPLLNVVRGLGISGGAFQTGNLTLIAGTNMSITSPTAGFFQFAVSGTTAVSTIAASGNVGLSGNVILQAGTGVALGQSGQNISISGTTIAATGSSGLSGNVILQAGTGISLGQSGQDIAISGTTIAASGNTALHGNVILQAGTGVSLTQTGQNISIAATGSGGSFTAPVTTYLTSTGTTAGYLFVVSSANATVGATYTNNGNTYTVLDTIAAGLFLAVSGASAPTSSGTLTKASGTGDSTITFTKNQAMAQVLASTLAPSGTPLYYEITTIGGGGGGGNASSNPANPGGGGGGGGGGSFIRISGATFGSSRYYTIGGAGSGGSGIGGISALETLVLATGGGGGAPGSGTNGMVAFGGYGGNLSYGQGVGLGDIVVGGCGGACGGPGIPSVAAGNGGSGGPSAWGYGGGGIGTSNTGGTNIPSAGTNYGGGGGGGPGSGSGAGGGPGIIVIKACYQ